MLTVAYLANQFPSEVEPYVAEEIAELHSRGIGVVTGSVRVPNGTEMPEIVLQQMNVAVLRRAMWLLLTKWKRILPLLKRIRTGRESPGKRIKAMLHTFLGAYYAARLHGRNVDHIHVHHGYFGAWIGMTAARLMNVGFSMTLHGSDLLLSGSYLDSKLAYCDFCITISEYNRNYILRKFPEVEPGKIFVSRLGVDVPATLPHSNRDTNTLSLLAVGRLREVKDHAFLLRVCAELVARGVRFSCRIAGDGPERRRLESLIESGGLQERVTLLGHIARRGLDALYQAADVVVLTSRSEGIPLVLMEAMTRGKIVVAPAITGIPELVRAGETGFAYKPGSVKDCASQLQVIHQLLSAEGRRESAYLEQIRRNGIAYIEQNFNRVKNLETFGNLFVTRIAARGESRTDANLILQQI